MNRICATRIVCGAPPSGSLLGETLNADFPVNNLSSEATDGPDFPGVIIPPVVDYSPIPPDPQPPTTDGNETTYWAQGCLGLCRATTQELADLCAAAQAYICAHTPPPDSGFPTVGFAISNAASCTFLCPDGSHFIYTVPAGSFTDVNQTTADQVAIAYACFRGAQLLMCLSDLAAGCAGADYADFITPTGGTAPFQYQIMSGALPPGLDSAQIGNSFHIGGTPSTPGNYVFTLRVTDAQGNIMQRTYTLAIVGISNASSLPGAVPGNFYTEQLLGAGGTGSYTFVITSGALPAGLTMDPSGLISGTPTAAETAAFTVMVTIGATSCTKSFTIKSGSIDWSQLVWDKTGDTAGSCAGASITDNCAGASIDCSATGACGLGGGVCAGALPQGAMTYTGPGGAAHLSLTCFLQSGGGGGTFAGAAITILQDAVPILDLPLVNMLDHTGEFDFNVAAGAGSNISVVINVDACNAGDIASMIGTLS